MNSVDQSLRPTSIYKECVTFSINLSNYTIISHYSLLGLQMTNVEQEERVTSLEENGGEGNSQRGK